MLHYNLRPRSGPSKVLSKTKSKSIVKKRSQILKTNLPNLNFPGYNERDFLEDMLDAKVDQFTSVFDSDSNMEDQVDEVIMDSDDNEEIIPKSPEE